MSTTPCQASQTARASGYQPEFGMDLAKVMQKLEEINCLLAAVDVLTQAAYERGVADGRAMAAAEGCD
jgi:hypothetical protein